MRRHDYDTKVGLAMSLFLSPHDLVELTEYRQLSAQRRWLDTHGWKYETDRFGRPKILRAELERKMIGRAAASREKVPDISAVRRAA